MISVPSQVTIGSIDTALGQLHEDPDSALSIPSTLSCRSILSSASYIQFLLTWAGLSGTKEIVLTVKSHEDIPFLGTSAETLIPLVLARKVSVHNLEKDSLDEVDLTQIRKKGLELFAQLQGGLPIQKDLFGTDEFESNTIPRKGSRVHLIAADATQDYCSPNWFYRGPKEARKLRGPADFPSLVRSVIKLVRARSVRSSGAWLDGLSDDLGSMLYELIDNTHKWGRHGINEEPVHSIRGALFDLRFDFPGNQIRLADIAKEIPLIGEFISFHQTQPKTRNLGLFEVSVFDGGIGLPQRELSRIETKVPTIEQEYEATRTCLQKWGSTSGERGRGLGLDRVLDLAARHCGFIYLRTGRLALYRDFANNPASILSGEQIGGFEKHRLDDATTHNNYPTTRHKVAGTLFTVVLPFNASTST